MQTGTYVHPILRPDPLYRRRPMSNQRFHAWWFREQMRAKKVSQRRLAVRLGLDPSAVSLMLRDKPKRRMQLREAATIAEVLGVPLADVLEHAGIPVNEISPGASGMLAVAGLVDADGRVSEAAPESGRFAPAPPGAPEDCRALRFDTAMTPREAWDGWVLYYTPSETVTDAAVGRLCVVHAESGEVLVRLVRRSTGLREYDLLDLCGERRSTSRLIAAAPIYWMSGP